MWQDLRAAWRFLRRRPTGFAVAVLTLALAIAVCTLAVGFFDQAFWRPVDSSRNLLTLYNQRPAAPGFQVLSYPDYVGLRDELREDVDVAAFLRVWATIRQRARPSRVQGELVSGNYFRVLAATTIAGRPLEEGDVRVGPSDPRVILGYDLWRRDFGSDRLIIGSRIRLGRAEYTVVGVAAPGFHGATYPSDFWVALTLTPQFLRPGLLSRADVPLFQTVARPLRDLDVAQVDGRVRGLSTSASADGWRLAAFPARYLRFWPAYRSTAIRFGAILVSLAFCVLIVACANLGGLLMARAGERQRELTLRLALGASRLQLARRLGAEAGLLTSLGGAIGLLLAAWGATLLDRVPLPVPSASPVGIVFDMRLGAIGIGVWTGAALLFVAISVFSAFRRRTRSLLVLSVRTIVPASGLRHVLAAGQIAIACVLLTIAGLLLRSAINAAAVDVGFDSADRLTATLTLSDQGYTEDTGLQFYRRLQDELAGDPAVEDVAFGWNPLLRNIRSIVRVSVGADSPALDGRYDVLTPGFFDTLNIPITSGRDFDSRDTSHSEPVAIVNEALAARMNAAVDEMLTIAGEPSARRIVGIVRNVTRNGLGEAPAPFVYLPLAQAFRPDMQVYVHTHTNGAEGLLRRHVSRLDPNVALSDVASLSAQVDAAREVPRTSAMVSAGATGIGVLLALIGIYGVLATSVEHRRREIAIRAALGASSAQVISRVLRHGAVLTIAGVGVGWTAGLAASQVLTSLLIGIDPHDPLVLALSPVLLCATSACAWLVPARRAAMIDAAAALKSE